MPMKADRSGVLLTRQQRDTPQGIEFIYWLRGLEGAFSVQIPGQHAVFFICQTQLPEAQACLAHLHEVELRPLALRDLRLREVAGVYCRSLQAWHQARLCLQQAGVVMMEEDIRPVDRYLSERFIFASASCEQTASGMRLRPHAGHPITLRTLSLDIETTLRADRILSVALQGEELAQVWMLGKERSDAQITYCASEKRLLQRVLAAIRAYDPDLLIGWNVIGFDLRVLSQRAAALDVPMLIGRDHQPLRLEQSESGRWFARVGGRVVLDGIDTLKGATWQFERYSLEHVAQALLGRGKAIDHINDRGQEIQRLFREDQPALARYNLEDCRLVSDIFAHTGLVDYLLERARLTGLALDKVGGSAQAFDNLYLPQLHRAGYVAPQYASGMQGLQVPGGFVMESRPGLYRHVLVLDFKSLYPSIIRSFLIDPLGLSLGVSDEVEESDRVAGFHGAFFSRRHALLPGIIARLWQARDRARAEGNAALAQAIKIQMNACYGVLGSALCRFYDQRLSASITLRGQQILTRTAEYIESRFGHQVIYGDTDSVFVWLGDAWPDKDTDAEGRRLAAAINDWWQAQLADEQLESALELQYETHYTRFLMPRMRHSEQGSKKRYAGLKRTATGEELVFRGLEQVRSDWTRLARDFQAQLFDCIFRGQPWQQWLQAQVRALLRGELDEQLVYHRRLRRAPEAYEHNLPPHVRAARQLNQHYRAQGLPEPLQQGDTVAYVISVKGPQAAELCAWPIDYQHYVDKQLRPVADSILPFVGSRFDDWVAPQITLF